ncbi:hypothetical protein Q73A0000_00215 [Kaistella flava (ex Peng et al. 2021)]|uniref:Uncharacterized protein n=1 Tax=Kaistella flava (ex Peng et al. 2021) TaxID=2038776 RepID=A0A7M2Y4V2_9FLAO|nr:hypothetical protein [Kaistella flava (ex Peng et al. 2021)]QOW08879.1 hypothetical protein Q73A0000_00215 [Kaistella flava (ex Peng et al. 2021)]
MKIKITLLIVLISSIGIFGQNFDKLLYSKKDKPTVLINENIIANWEVVNTLPKEAIKEMIVMKSMQKDQYAATFPNLSQYGLILCKVDSDNIETKTQHEIKTFLGADLTTKIYVDGFLLMNDNYLIATKSIKEIEFINPNEQDLNEDKIINIWTLTKDTRLGSLDLRKTELQKNK